MTDIHGTVFAIYMPLDKDYRGPVPDDEVVYHTWEVWDDVNQTICSCRDKDDAVFIASCINNR